MARIPKEPATKITKVDRTKFQLYATNEAQGNRWVAAAEKEGFKGRMINEWMRRVLDNRCKIIRVPLQ